MNTVEGTREYLLKYNIKPSLQRMAIMDYLMAHRVHPTADEIYNALYPTMPTLSKTTIYNTMKLFTEQGAVKALVIDEKNVRFDIDTSSHAHFMCLECGCESGCDTIGRSRGIDYYRNSSLLQGVL